MQPEANLVQRHIGYNGRSSADRGDPGADFEPEISAKPSVIVAPGRVFLFGEYADAGDGCAVVAAVTRHAKARFAAGVDVASEMVTKVIKRARLELGEVFAALPTGSVSVDVSDFRDNVRLSGLGSSSAASVATVGALLEALGLPIDGRKQLILATATAGRRGALGQLGSGAGSMAATYGGLVQISCLDGTAPEGLPLGCPAGLHLVLFSAPCVVSPPDILRAIQRYAVSNRASFDARNLSLRDYAQSFVTEIGAGRTDSAIRAARGYADELASLGDAASVPMMSEPFTLASGIARDLGGAAKPTGAGRGNIGVALFASRQAADQFRQATAQYLTLLDGDLDRHGVRCAGPPTHFDEGPTLVDGLVSEPTVGSPVAVLRNQKAVTIGSAIDDVDSAPRVIGLPPPVAASVLGRVRRLLFPMLVIGGAAVLGAWLALITPARARVHKQDRSSSSEPAQPPVVQAPAFAEIADEDPSPARQTRPDSAGETHRKTGSGHRPAQRQGRSESKLPSSAGTEASQTPSRAGALRSEDF